MLALDKTPSQHVITHPQTDIEPSSTITRCMHETLGTQLHGLLAGTQGAPHIMRHCCMPHPPAARAISPVQQHDPTREGARADAVAQLSKKDPLSLHAATPIKRAEVMLLRPSCTSAGMALLSACQHSCQPLSCQRPLALPVLQVLPPPPLRCGPAVWVKRKKGAASVLLLRLLQLLPLQPWPLG